MLHIMCNIYYTYIIISYKNYIYIIDIRAHFRPLLGVIIPSLVIWVLKKKNSLEMVENGMCWECNPRKCPFSNKCAPKNMPIPPILISRIGPVYIYTHKMLLYAYIYIYIYINIWSFLNEFVVLCYLPKLKKDIALVFSSIPYQLIKFQYHYWFSDNDWVLIELSFQT